MSKYLQALHDRPVQYELRLERLLFVLYAHAGVFILLVWERDDVEGWHSLSFSLRSLQSSSTIARDNIHIFPSSAQ